MVPKMRALLRPQTKDEVDFLEATKDLSNVYLWWLDDSPAGSRAFIPDIEDRDTCLAALQIYSCAAEEAERIPEEFNEAFGFEGPHMYNELICLIGEKEKKCLPFVNMCLRAWMERLSDDVELWADVSVLDFEKWILTEMEKPIPQDCVGKTSFQLMMSVFGGDQLIEEESKICECQQQCYSYFVSNTNTTFLIVF